MQGHNDAAHLRFALQDGFKQETVEIGSLDGEHVALEVWTDDSDVLHIIVWDSQPREQGDEERERLDATSALVERELRPEGDDTQGSEKPAGWNIPVEDPEQAERNARTDLCEQCKDAEHDTCSLDPTCACCVTTITAMADEA